MTREEILSVEQYYPKSRIPAKVLFGIQEIMDSTMNPVDEGSRQ